MKIFALIMSSLYILSGLYNWNFFHKSYNKGGKWEGKEPEWRDVILTFLPVFNMALTFMLLTIKMENSKVLYKIYQIKK